MRSTVLAIAATLALVTSALAGLQVELRSGNSVKGTLDPATEVEAFSIDVPAGAVLSVKASGARGGPAVAVRVLDETDAVVEGGVVREQKRGVRAKVPLLRGGAYSVEVSSRDGETPGAYSLKVSWKSPRRFKEAPPAGPVAGTVEFRADQGALVTAQVRAERSSDVIPEITHITGPQGFEVRFDEPEKRASDRVKKVAIEFTGDHTVHYTNSGAGGGEVDARVTVKPPNSVKTVFDLTNVQIDGGETDDGDSGAAAAAVALPDAQTLVAVEEPEDASDPLARIAGASVSVPPGAVKRPVAIVVATSSNVDVPQDEVRTLVGPPVFFGPDGIEFKTPVTIVLPAEVVADQDDVAVLRRSGDTTSILTEGLTVEDGQVSLPVSGFSTYQVISATPPEPTEQKLTASDAAAEDFFGWSVAVSGDTIVVGAILDDDAGFNAGAAYVFTRDGAGGFDETKLVGSDSAQDSTFGVSVAISGDTIVVGASGHQDLRGAAYVFTPDGAGGFDETPLVPSDAGGDEEFGISVGISGNGTIAIAASGDDGFTGSVYVYTPDGLGGYDETRLTASDRAGADSFGYSVAIEGDTIVVGAIADDDGGNDSGSAYVYTPDGMGGYDETKLTASDGGAEDRFGYSVAIAGGTIVVGAIHDDDTAEDAGAAYVFTPDGAGGYDETKLTASDGNEFNLFGNAVAISGDTVVVGAELDSDVDTHAGAAYVFTPNGAGGYDERKLVASDTGGIDHFGYAVAIAGDTIVVGSIFDDDGALDAGAAYLFDLDPLDLF